MDNNYRAEIAAVLHREIQQRLQASSRRTVFCCFRTGSAGAIEDPDAWAHEYFKIATETSNEEVAFVCFTSILQFWTRYGAPHKWADVQVILGIFFQRKELGDRSQNVEASITCFRAALEVRTRYATPLDWATTLMCLGVALVDRIAGEKSANIEDAIACYRAALEVRTRDAAPLDWAATQMCLGIALSNRIAGDKSANMEDAIACYRAALEVRTQGAAPLEWAGTQNNLGNALRGRIAGEKSSNMEEAVACYRAALEVRTQDEVPLDWATTQNNLGDALGDCIAGDKSVNIERSISCYRSALEVWTKDAAPLAWALTQTNLGGSLQCRIAGAKSTNIEDAIACYWAALEVWTQDATPIEWATTQKSLGVALGDRIAGDKSANMVDAIACYRAALEVRTKDAAPLDWATLCCKLSTALLNYAMHVGAANEEYFDISHESLTRVGDALTVLSSTVFPLKHLLACRARAFVLARLYEPEYAVEAVKAAMNALQHAQSLSASGYLHSRSLGEDYDSLCGLYVALCLHLDGPRHGLEAAESSRAALQHSMIAQKVNVKACLPEHDRPEFEEASNRLRVSMYEVDCAAGKGADYDDLAAEYEAAKKEVESFERIAQRRSPDLEGGRQLGAKPHMQKVLRFVRDADAMTIVFVFAPLYEDLATGDEKDVLHAFVVWNDGVHVLIDRSVHYPWAC
jgi:tetratricopeptide (TPR) repeat protein